MSEMSWEHAAEARAALSEIVNDPQFGAAALSNGPTMSNLLKDLLPDAPREKSILVAAAEAGLAGSLRDHVAQGMDTATATRLAASSLAASTPFTPDACTWVADEFAIALGLRQPAGPGGAGLPPAPEPAGPADAQAMPTQVAPIPGYQPGQQGTQGAAGPGAGPTVPGAGQQGGWQPGGGQQPGQPGGWQQPAQPGGWQQPAQPGGWQQPVQPGGWQPAQPGYGPGGPVRPRSSKRGWFIGGGVAVVVIIVIAIAASLASKGSSSNPTAGGGTHSHSPTPTPTTSSPTTSPTTPVLPAGVDPLATIFHPSGHAPPGSDCTSTANTNTQNLNTATIVTATFCDRTFTPYANIHLWAYQFDSTADYLTAVSRLNQWTGYDTTGPTSGSCPPRSPDPRGKTGWHSITNPKYHTQHSDQFLECYTDHVKSTGGSAKAFLLWTLPSQDVVFIGENTAGNSASNFTYLVHWWEHIAYA